MIIEDDLLKKKIQQATDEFNAGQAKINNINLQQESLVNEIEKIKEIMLAARGRIIVCQELLASQMRGPQEKVVSIPNKEAK